YDRVGGSPSLPPVGLGFVHLYGTGFCGGDQPIAEKCQVARTVSSGQWIVEGSRAEIIGYHRLNLSTFEANGIFILKRNDASSFLIYYGTPHCSLFTAHCLLFTA
ncbi:MAG TPA: hypothetical protein VFF68_02175, partial [Anaerolineaceae bacterium]|nr:hypothetical protein [Anaerolineaceae bacterium]